MVAQVPHHTQRMIDRVEARIDTTPPKVSAVKVVVPLEEELVNEPTQLRDRRDRVHDLLLGTTIDIELQEGVRGTAKVSRAPVHRYRYRDRYRCRVGWV